jgi:hypothetical protein
MTPEEQNPHPSVHHQTIRGARLALARKEISQESYRAVLRGEISLSVAKELGRSGTPIDTAPDRSGPGPTTETPGRPSAEGHQDGTDKAQKFCLCGCGEPVTRTFRPGHDSRLRSELVAQIRKGDVLLRSERITDEQREFAVRHGLIGEDALPPETGEEGSDV